MFKFTPATQAIVKRLTDAGGTPFMVGGAVRDALLGRKVKDVDIEVHGLPLESIVAAFSGLQVDLVGQQFGVVLVTLDGESFDVSVPRRESKIGVGHTGFLTEFDPSITIEEASARRDFTMNAIMVDMVTGRVHDPHGGAADIMARTIRHTSEAFSEDPLRILRAVQFAARFGFEVAPETVAESKKCLSEFPSIAKERVWGEWEKIGLSGRDFRPALRFMDATGLSFGMGGVNFKQADRFNLAAGACDRERITGQRRINITLSALAMESTTFSGRWADGDVFMENIGAPEYVRKAFILLAEHQSVGSFDTSSQARRLARKLFPITLREAHCFGSISDEVLFDAQMLECLDAPLDPFLNGNHLIEAGYKPGPEFGNFLDLVTERQDMGYINSLEDALAELDRLGPRMLKSNA